MVDGHGTSSAVERAADLLREQITEGRHAPGAALREASLAAELGASRNTVREAFRLLAHDGLVEHAQHRGVTVRRLHEVDVADIYRIRRTLEGLGLRQVAADAKPLDEIVAEAEQAADRRDWVAVATADLRFHQAVVAALGSDRLDQLCRRLLAELRLVFVAMPDPDDFHRPYLERNRALVDLLVVGEVERAAEELERYLRDAEAEIVRVLRIRGDAT